MAKAYVKHDYAVTGRDYVETEGGGGGGGGVNYSTEEQDTGLKWINGRSIYQKTIVYKSIVDVSPDTWTASNVTIADFDFAISAWGLSDTNTLYNLNCAYIESAIKLQACRVSGSNAPIKTLTLQYLKTE